MFLIHVFLCVDFVVGFFFSRFITDSSTFTIERRTIYELSIVRGWRTAQTFGREIDFDPM